jgi:hemolysin-activating ACP:hemolysin acyltransferase
MLTNEAGTNGSFRALKGAPQGQRVVLDQPTALANIVTLMLQSPTHQLLNLSDLRWKVWPPLMLGQLAIETKLDQSGSRQPVAAMIWASVSAEVDARLSSNLSAPIQLRPDEWRSGDILWIADIVGDTSIGHALVKKVLLTTLAGRKVRVRSLNGDGKPVLLEINDSTVSVVGTSAPSTCGSCAPSSTGTLCASCVTTGCTGRCRSGKAAHSAAVSR